MKNKRLDNICSEILDYMEEHDAISEERVLSLFKGLALCEEDDEKPTSYMRLFDEINEKWNYREIHQQLSEQVFLYGAIWGCLQLMETKQKALADQVEASKNWTILLRKYQDKLNLLKHIHASPGIRHKRLAEKEGISPSQLSQSMVGLVKDELITYNYAGRQKFYFLSAKGEKLYRKLNEKKQLKRKQGVRSKQLSMENIENFSEAFINEIYRESMRNIIKDKSGSAIVAYNRCGVSERLCNSVEVDYECSDFFGKKINEVNQEWPNRKKSFMMK